LIPANGFYEWKRTGKVRKPYYIHRKDDRLLAIAGLYDIWNAPGGEELPTFAIITTEPNPLISRYHDGCRQSSCGTMKSDGWSPGRSYGKSEEDP
jgi:putative SOS response-associated peptidase YedK